jgi:hypothetical protein
MPLSRARRMNPRQARAARGRASPHKSHVERSLALYAALSALSYCQRLQPSFIVHSSLRKPSFVCVLFIFDSATLRHAQRNEIVCCSVSSVACLSNRKIMARLLDHLLASAKGAPNQSTPEVADLVGPLDALAANQVLEIMQD